MHIRSDVFPNCSPASSSEASHTLRSCLSQTQTLMVLSSATTSSSASSCPRCLLASSTPTTALTCPSRTPLAAAAAAATSSPSTGRRAWPASTTSSQTTLAGPATCAMPASSSPTGTVVSGSVAWPGGASCTSDLCVGTEDLYSTSSTRPTRRPSPSGRGSASPWWARSQERDVSRTRTPKKAKTRSSTSMHGCEYLMSSVATTKAHFKGPMLAETDVVVVLPLLALPASTATSCRGKSWKTLPRKRSRELMLEASSARLLHCLRTGHARGSVCRQLKYLLKKSHACYRMLVLLSFDVAFIQIEPGD